MSKKLFPFFLLIASFGIGCNNSEQPITETQKPVASTTPVNEKGKQLFYSRCASCHFVNKEMTGPALRGVEARWPDKQKLYAFIRNSEQVIKNDQYAHALWLQYNQTMMNKHEDLSDEDIHSILEYIADVSIEN